MIIRKAIAPLLIVLASGNAVAGQTEALEVFQSAACGALNFQGDRMVEDISNSFMHFTKSGRASLISELSRVGVLTQSVSNSGALRCVAIPQGLAPVGRRVGENGLDEYDVKTEVNLEWSRCEGRSCSKSGPSKKAVISGTVATLSLNGRLAYKLTRITVQEGLGK